MPLRASWKDRGGAGPAAGGACRGRSYGLRELVAAQKAVDDAVAAREALEDEWLELSDKLGIE